jgi:hypothetical protein
MKKPGQHRILVESVPAHPTVKRRMHAREDVVVDPAAVVERLDVVVAEA